MSYSRRVHVRSLPARSETKARMHAVITKRWDELSPGEIDEMSQNEAREWNSRPLSAATHGQRTFFLLENEDGGVEAQGQLFPINGVRFANEAYDILGIAGIIATPKGQGNGRRLMLAMKDYLSQDGRAAVGFTDVPGFYQKCGYGVDRQCLKRFVHVVEGVRIVNSHNNWVLHRDSRDGFMQRVFAAPDKDVSLPRDPDW